MAVQARVSGCLTCVCKVLCSYCSASLLELSHLADLVLDGVQASLAGHAPARSEISKKIISANKSLRTVPKRIRLQPNRTQTTHDIITDQPVARRLYCRARGRL